MQEETKETREAELEQAQETANMLMTAVQAANDTLRAYMDNVGGEKNYFKSMEWLLYNYYELAELVADAGAYMDRGQKDRSKSLVIYRKNAGGLPKDEAEDAAERARADQYACTKARFDEIARVVKIYGGRREMRVVRLYYFRENENGERRDADSKRMTFEEIAEAMGSNEKTIRQWRNKIVNDMAVALFGKPAAVEAGMYRRMKRQGLTGTQ